MTKIKQLGHVVLFVSDPKASADWYHEVLGTELVTYSEPLSGAFLSFGRRDHDIALFQAPGGGPVGHHQMAHMAMEIDGDAAAFKAFHAKLLDKGVRITALVDHGISYGLYFLDPDGHQLEVFYQYTQPDAAAKEMVARDGAIAQPISPEEIREA